MNIVFLGDVVGKPGRKIVKDFLTDDFEKVLGLKKEDTFLIANVENASHGFGLTQKNYEDFVGQGFNCLTSGNHIWDKKDIFTYIDEADILLRPFNYPKDTKGIGYKIFEFKEVKIGVINMLGRVFMSPYDSPWETVKTAIEEIKKETSIIFVDFHAEATAEKICFAKYCSDLGVSVVAGTHTHVQTADERIINEQTAFITDVGFCGDYNGVIGMEYETSLHRLTTNLPERFDIAQTNSCVLNGVLAVVSNDGKAKTIKRFCITKNYEEGIK
ncbi:YmdB family metallophosphoesterase [bacterium]|nr:YmdB family metallophosphoesterase [bacterium]